MSMNNYYLFCYFIMFQPVCILASDVQLSLLPQQKDQSEIFMLADDYPVLKEGFELCGRYNLQQFFDEKLQEFSRKDNQKVMPYEDGLEIGERVFDRLAHAIVPAQDLIVKVLSEDKILAGKFCKMLDHIIDNNLNLYTDSITTYFHRTTPHHISDRFFQYCIKIDFMNQVVHRYILDSICNDTMYRTSESYIYAVLQDIKDGNSSLYTKTIEKNNPQIMQFFINNGFGISNREIVQYAIACGASKIVFLVGIDLDLNDKQGNNLLHQAILSDNDRLISDYISIKPYIDQQNNDGDTPLHLLVKEEKYKFIPMLVAAGCNVKTINKYGSTPLHIIASKDNKKETSCCCINSGKMVEQKNMISLLIAHGANINEMNSYGQIPWDRAANEEIRDVLKPQSVMKQSMQFSINNFISSLHPQPTSKFKED